MASKININSTTFLLGIYVLYHAIWLNGRTGAAVTSNMDIHGEPCTSDLCGCAPSFETVQTVRADGCPGCHCVFNHETCPQPLCACTDGLTPVLQHHLTSCPTCGCEESTEVSCGDAFGTTPGEFQHPITSGSYYNSNEICTWTISSTLPLTFYFSRFNMEDDHDHVSLRDGGSIGSSLISKLTGKSLHYNFTTAGNAHIQFESDASVVGTGFVLHWRVYSAEDQCKDKNGFCVLTGDRCDGTFEMIQNTCDDLCTCCLPDTNNQGFCIDGVIIGNQCFKFSTEQLSWEGAKEKCLSQNARLASLNNPLAFQDYARINYGGEKFWLGGSDITNEGEFVWLNGNVLGTQFPWSSTQPDNNGDEDCLMWGFEGAFNDDPCHRSQKFVCEH